MIGLLMCLLLLNEDPFFETEEERDFEVILRDIEDLRNNPIDINVADVAALSRIPYLSLADCLRIVHHREEYGPFRSLDDLLNIQGFDLPLLSTIRPFIIIKAKALAVEKATTRMRLATKIPPQENSLKYYTRTQGVVGQYTISLVTEKDPYENSFFDYYGAGMVIDEGKRKIALGKYNLDLGTGVVLSTVGSFFRSIDFHVMTHERGIVPYTTSFENGGFFGAAISDSLVFDYTLFYSYQKLDGRIDSLGFASSFDESGVHTDSASLSRKDRISEELFGYDVRYRFSNLLISQRSYWCTYDPAFAARDSLTQFYGKHFMISGIALTYFGDLFVVFSEWARTYRNRIGGLFGFSGFFPYFDFNCAGKYFPAGFYSPKGVESDDDYVGGTVDLKHHSPIADIGATVTIDNKTEEDSVKYGLRLNFEKKIGIVSARVQVRWRYREEVKDLSGSRVFVRITPLRLFFFDIRFEEKYVYGETAFEKGIFGAVELGVEYKGLRLRMRYGLFDTDSYASRIFAYETDLPGILNNRMLYDEGNYGFVYCSFAPVKKLRLSLKYSIIRRDVLTSKQFGCQVDGRL